MSLPLAGAEIIKKEVVYLCDPSRNTKCRKTSCKYLTGPCNMTTDPNCAMLDQRGKPIVWQENYYEDGRIVRIEPRNRHIEAHDEIAMEAMAEVLDRYLSVSLADDIRKEVRELIMEKRAAWKEGQHESGR